VEADPEPRLFLELSAGRDLCNGADEVRARRDCHAITDFHVARDVGLDAILDPRGV
jgi:hypothetical protein